MATIKGYVTKEEFEELKERVGVSILKKEISHGNEEWANDILVTIDVDWSIKELLENFER